MFASRILAKIRNVQLQLELKFSLDSNNYRVEQPSAISLLKFLFSFETHALGEGLRCLPADASEDALHLASHESIWLFLGFEHFLFLSCDRTETFKVAEIVFGGDWGRDWL